MSDEIRAIPYEPAVDEEWDELVKGSRNGTLFHTRRFLRYHPPERFEDASLTFRQGNRLVAVLPAAWRQDPERGWILQSHPGASYGGLVFPARTRTQTIDGVIGALRDHAARAGAEAIRMRLPPRIFHRPTLEEIDFFLRFHGFTVARTELSSWMPLKGDHSEALLKSLSSRCRNAVRKALRASLEHGESDDVDQYWDIVADNLPRRYGTEPTHSREELHRLRELCPGEVRLFAAQDGATILAGALVFLCNDEVAHTFYLASREEAQAHRPLNLAVFSAMDWLRRHGWKRLNLGVSTPDGLSVNWGLLGFKESFNAFGTCRDTYELDLRTSEKAGCA